GLVGPAVDRALPHRDPERVAARPRVRPTDLRFRGPGLDPDPEPYDRHRPLLSHLARFANPSVPGRIRLLHWSSRTAMMGRVLASPRQQRPGDGGSPGARRDEDHPGAAGRTAPPGAGEAQ